MYGIKPLRVVARFVLPDSGVPAEKNENHNAQKSRIYARMSDACLISRHVKIGRYARISNTIEEGLKRRGPRATTSSPTERDKIPLSAQFSSIPPHIGAEIVGFRVICRN